MKIESIDQVKEAALGQIAEQCKEDLFFLCKEILGYDLLTEFTHREICDATSDLLPGKTGINKLLVLMPRGSLKSSIVTIGFTLQNLLNDPNIRILLNSETFSKSKAFLAEIKGHLESNVKFRKVFFHIYGVYPDSTKRDGLWSDSQLNIASRTKHKKEPTLSCAGIDVTKNGMHYDLIINDDLHSEKNVTNKEQIEQVKNHYKLSFSLLDPGKPIIVIGTRWDYDDLYQHIIDNESHRFKIIKKSAILDDGSLLFPEVLTHEVLDDFRKTMGNYFFSCQYLNEPVDNETAVFKRSYYRKRDWDLVKDRPMNWYVSVDPSFGGEYSDYAAFVLVGMDYERELFVRNIHRAKMNYSEIIDLMFDWYQRYSPVRMGLETVATQKSIQYMLNEEQKRRHVWLPVTEIRSRSKTKEERIRALAPYYEFGRIYHITECNNIEELEYELSHFPKGKHDDIIDALASTLEFATPPHGKNKIRDDDEPRKFAVLNKPRSPLIGY